MPGKSANLGHKNTTLPIFKKLLLKACGDTPRGPLASCPGLGLWEESVIVCDERDLSKRTENYSVAMGFFLTLSSEWICYLNDDLNANWNGYAN
jgi:hypothetical protein